MSTHQEFLQGFGDGFGLTLPEERQAVYQAWLRENNFRDTTRIEIEGGGYLTGLEAGHHYKQLMDQWLAKHPNETQI